VLLVADALTPGAVNLARSSTSGRPTGIVLTRIDATARGRRASMRAVTGKPIKLMAPASAWMRWKIFTLRGSRSHSRMGDIVSLVEKARPPSTPRRRARRRTMRKVSSTSAICRAARRYAADGRHRASWHAAGCRQMKNQSGRELDERVLKRRWDHRFDDAKELRVPRAQGDRKSESPGSGTKVEDVKDAQDAPSMPDEMKAMSMGPKRGRWPSCHMLVSAAACRAPSRCRIG